VLPSAQVLQLLPRAFLYDFWNIELVVYWNGLDRIIRADGEVVDELLGVIAARQIRKVLKEVDDSV
jgi:hypothetical protein